MSPMDMLLPHLTEERTGGLDAVIVSHLFLPNPLFQGTEVEVSRPFRQLTGGDGVEQGLNGHAQLASEEEIELPLGLGYEFFAASLAAPSSSRLNFRIAPDRYSMAAQVKV